ncbi:hypothetical protein BT69DRAFT_1335509 [Atractiella rhizophila]|nr:hypothetical protein BT69DRAFT_1335509 [Atractiella rhizophila]
MRECFQKSEYPWIYLVNHKRDVLFSRKCCGKLSQEDHDVGFTACDECHDVKTLPAYKAIISCIRSPKSKTQLSWQSPYSHLRSVHQHKKKWKESVLENLNNKRKIRYAGEDIETLQALIHAIKESHYSRIPELVKRGLKNRMSIKAITSLVIRASQGMYHMCSSTERILRIATIVRSYGGTVPLDTLRKEFGQFPSHTTIWRHALESQVRLTGFSGSVDARHNYHAFMPRTLAATLGPRGCSLGLDEIKLREMFTYDVHTKQLVDIKTCKSWVNDGSWHVAKYATVFGIMPLSAGVPPLIPISVSATCGKEDAFHEGKIIMSVAEEVNKCLAGR